MRAVKSVLVMAGQLKRKEPYLAEDMVLIRAMRDSNLPKFLKEDLSLFNAILQDLFPGKELPIVEYEKLLGAMRTYMKREHMQDDERLFTKILQFYETLNVRFGVMIIGPTLSGKTTLHTTLKASMNELAEQGFREFSRVES